MEKNDREQEKCKNTRTRLFSPNQKTFKQSQTRLHPPALPPAERSPRKSGRLRSWHRSRWPHLKGWKPFVNGGSWTCCQATAGLSALPWYPLLVNTVDRFWKAFPILWYSFGKAGEKQECLSCQPRQALAGKLVLCEHTACASFPVLMAHGQDLFHPVIHGFGKPAELLALLLPVRAKGKLLDPTSHARGSELGLLQLTLRGRPCQELQSLSWRRS